MFAAWPLDMSSFRRTFSLDLLGTSMPTAVRPAMLGMMRTFGARSARARSFAIVSRRATRVPASSSTEYTVTTGPHSMPEISPLMPYCSSVLVSSSACSCTIAAIFSE